MPLHWLLGGPSAARHDQAPETPVHSWVLDAFRNALGPDTPVPKAQHLYDSPATAANNANSILKTPGYAKEKKNVNVTFHKSVRTPPKRKARSGLPNQFSGKFPSPFTPKDLSLPESDARDKHCEDFSGSPIGVVKDRHLSSRFTSSLKSFSVRTTGDNLPTAHKEKTAQPPVLNRERENTERHPSAPRDEPSLAWDLNKGFEEVLQSIAKNNAYLQDLINEMQESLVQAEESFSDVYSLAGSDVTMNMDEPKSSSGKFWRSKFLDFKLLTEKLKDEQNNMEKALAKLRSDIDQSDGQAAAQWKQRCEALAEDLDRERRSSKNSAQMREIRELRRNLRESQAQIKAQGEVQAQLDIANHQIQDLHAQLQAKNEDEAQKRSESEQALRSPDPTPASQHDVTSTSATARRLARIRASANSYPAPTIATTLSALPDLAKSEPTTVGVLDNRTFHRRFSSRTRDVVVHEDEGTPAAHKTSTRPKTSPTTSSPLVSLTRNPSSSHPKFISLNVNQATSTKSRESKQTDTETRPDVIKRTAIQEHAKRRLEDRRLQRRMAAEKDRVALSAVTKMRPSSSGLRA